MKQPDFFIIGAPKCGTTALATYLGEHPQIFMCRPKEPHYFADDFPNYRFVTRWENYLDLFTHADETHQAIGEASVFYLRSDVAVQNLLTKIPSARLIVMLRNPMELAQSMHAQALYNRDETVADFQMAWRLRENRRHGGSIPKKCRDVKTLLYDDLASLGAQMEALLKTVPRKQVRWWFYDDFAADPARVYAEVLAFLGVAHDGRSAFLRVNARKRARYQWLAEFTQKPPRLLLWVSMRLKALFGIHHWNILSALRSRNFVVGGSMPLSPELWSDMRTVFDADVRILERLTGRDLSSWFELTESRYDHSDRRSVG